MAPCHLSLILCLGRVWDMEPFAAKKVYSNGTSVNGLTPISLTCIVNPSTPGWGGDLHSSKAIGLVERSTNGGG